MRRGPFPGTSLNQTPNTVVTIPGVSVRAIMFVHKRETTLIAS